MRLFIHPSHFRLHPPISFFFAWVLFSSLASQSIAQEKKDGEKEPAAVKLSLPLAVSAGATTKVTIRGVKLDEASEVKSGNEKARLKLSGKGKATAPNMTDAAKVGDTQVEIELTLAKDVAAGDLPLTVVTPSGEVSFILPVLSNDALVDAKEPQDSFAKAQAIEPGNVVLEAIEKPKDVDVFRIELAIGQRLVAEVHAARQGSPLDSILTLYDIRRQIVAASDDHGGVRDARIEFTPPSNGTYFLSLIDAHDLGSMLHAYRLTVRVE